MPIGWSRLFVVLGVGWIVTLGSLVLTPAALMSAVAAPSGIASPFATYDSIATDFEATPTHVPVGRGAPARHRHSVGAVGTAVSGTKWVSQSGVAAKSVDELAEVGFRSDASHIFRSKAGHFAEDTAENRSLIQSAVNPANLRETVTLRDGASLSKYYLTRSDGTQLWAEVRNGQITNGGLNVTPR